VKALLLGDQMDIQKINNSIDKNSSNVQFRIKLDISSDPKVWDALAKLEGLNELTAGIKRELGEKYPTEDLEQAAPVVAEEILTLRKNPGTYLVSTEGQALFKITPDMIFTPEPVPMEDGSMRAIAPRLHPKISSGIVLALHESNKLADLEAKYPNSEALQHLKDPWVIVEKAARIIIEQNGPSVSDNTWEDYREIVFEFGKENVNGVFQAFNPEFIRVNVFAKSLARKIVALNCTRYLIAECNRKSDSTYSWYEVIVHYEV
jgi:hypothetical protein